MLLPNIGLVILVRIGSNVILAFLHLPTRALLLLSALILLKIVGGYLQKEANFTIVSNKGFDLDSCIAKAKSNLAKVVPKITLKNAHRFFNDTHIAMMYPKPLTEEAFLSAISDDIYMGNDDFVPFMPKLHQIYIAYDVAYQGGNLNNYK